MRIIEFFCGIGGFAAALGQRGNIVAAIDISLPALEVYWHNFSHSTITREIETIPVELLREWDAELWWLSPPCQPYTRRGCQRDVDDPRANSLLALTQHIDAVRPTYIALENVPAFATSQAHDRLRNALQTCGYTVHEQLLCPTQLGIPMRRERFYLIAGLYGISTPSSTLVQRENSYIEPLKDYIDPTADEDPRLRVAPGVTDRYRQALHLADRNNPLETVHCFTAAYGRSLVRSGSYLRMDNRVRRFSPREILSLMGFPRSFRLPQRISLQKAWQLAGNSLSITAVRHIVEPIWRDTLSPAAARPLAFRDDRQREPILQVGTKDRQED